MLWLLLAIACLYPVIRYRAFWRTLKYKLLAVAGLIVAAIALYMAGQKFNEELAKHKEESLKHLIRADQLVFTDWNMGPNNYGTPYAQVFGRIKNTSPYSLSEVIVKIDILDCDPQSQCDIVGENPVLIFAQIPPGQVRDVGASTYFGSDTRVRGKFQWNYQITEIRASPATDDEGSK